MVSAMACLCLWGGYISYCRDLNKNSKGDSEEHNVLFCANRTFLAGTGDYVISGIQHLVRLNLVSKQYYS